MIKYVREKGAKSACLLELIYTLTTWCEYSIFKCFSLSDHYCEEYYKYLITNTW